MILIGENRMNDVKSDDRFIVLIDKDKGPYVHIKYCRNLNLLHELLGQKYHLIYLDLTSPELKNVGECTLYFGVAADEMRLKDIFDEITLTLETR
jgi:hypothetical protein